MAGLVDYLVLGVGAYYLGTRVQDKDDDFNRALAAVATGGAVYAKGPEFYKAIKDNIASGSDEDNDKLLGAAIGALGGLYAGDKVGSRIRKTTPSSGGDNGNP